MGLDEKRKTKELAEITLPARQKELMEISGAEVKYDVDWASFADDLKALNFFDNISCHRIAMAFRDMCMDQLGKDSLKAGIKTIKLKNVKEKKDMKIDFTGGVLEIHSAYAQLSDGYYSDLEIRNVIAKGL